MTKRLSIALIAAALFVVLAVLPVSASTVNPNNFNGTVIDAGATVFIGEQGINLTRAMNQADFGYSIGNDGRWLYQTPTNTTIAWWASGSTSDNPDYSIDIQANYRSYTIDQDTYVGRTGNWYLISKNGNTVTKMGAVMNVLDPKLSVTVWDWSQNGKDVTGLNVVQGERLDVKVSSDLYAATYASRNNTVWVRTYDPAAVTSLPSGTIPGLQTNTTGALPAGAVTGTSYTDVVNATVFVGTPYTNVWKVVNYSTIAKMTYAGEANDPIGLGGSAYQNITTDYYWNNTAGGAATETSFSGNNYSTSPYGLSPLGANQTAMAFGWFGAGQMVTAPTPVTDGFVSIKVKTEAGATLSRLKVGTDQTNAVYNSTSYQFVNNDPWYFGDSKRAAAGVATAGALGWITDALTNGQYDYPVGTYQVWAESMLNNMKDNYRNAGADFTGKTISATGTVTLVSDSVKIEANKDSVVRSKTFSVTVTGKASTQYYVWVKNSNTLTGGYDDQAPYIVLGQDKVYFDCIDAQGAPTAACAALAGDNTQLAQDPNHPIGNFEYENGGGAANNGIIWDNVAWNTTAAASVFKSRYYALINTSTSGTRTVEFSTTNWTKEGKYTIRIEQHMPTDFAAGGSGYGAAYLGNGAFKSDEVDVNVEKGAVTIVAAGDGSYYLGEEIKLSGTNTETYKTYIFLIGPNLPEYGAVITNQDPRHAGSQAPTTYGVQNGVVADFKVVDVQGDNTWSWKWGTASYALDAGTYTVYAASQPSDKKAEHLANCAYGTVSIIIKKPFVSATASQSTVAKGDRVFITGTAQGDPDQVKIWIMGKNRAEVADESVNSDSSFSYEIKKETTKDWASGQYFVVVQHPMQNKVFDVDLVGNNVVNKQLISSLGGTYTRIFTLLGANSLQGSDAAEALAEGINDANVDDTYTKLQFLVEEPKITIDPVGDKHVGDKFTVTAQTNLAVDDEVLVQIYSSSFKPTQKSQSGEFSGATGTRKVTKGDSGMNKITFDVDSSTFKPDEYIVTEDAVLQDATGTILFNVLETSVTAAPTAVVTTAAQTAAQTAAPTAVQTAAPTAAATTKSPGFGALIALIGLGAVAFVVVRRH